MFRLSTKPVPVVNLIKNFLFDKNYFDCCNLILKTGTVDIFMLKLKQYRRIESTFGTAHITYRNCTVTVP